MFGMSCSHRKVSLVKFPLVSTSSYTFLQCFAITCETQNPNHKLSTIKSCKAMETCATNETLSPLKDVPTAKTSYHIDVPPLIVTYL
jgi:hypothetical protein